MPSQTTPIIAACQSTSAAIAVRNRPRIISNLRDVVSEVTIYVADQSLNVEERRQGQVWLETAQILLRAVEVWTRDAVYGIGGGVAIGGDVGGQLLWLKLALVDMWTRLEREKRGSKNEARSGGKGTGGRSSSGKDKDGWSR